MGELRSLRVESAFAASGGEGFTLLEMIIAMVITSMVIFMISSSFSFTSRMWIKSEQDERVRDLELLVDLMAVQLGSYYVFDIQKAGGLQGITGTRDTLVIATSHSVKAMNGGAPVLARYEFDPGTGRMLYAELPIDWNKKDELLRFANTEVMDDANAVSYAASEFSFEYVSEDTEDMTDEWQGGPHNLGALNVIWRENEQEQEQTRTLSPGYLDFLS